MNFSDDFKKTLRIALGAILGLSIFYSLWMIYSYKIMTRQYESMLDQQQREAQIKLEQADKIRRQQEKMYKKLEKELVGVKKAVQNGEEGGDGNSEITTPIHSDNPYLKKSKKIREKNKPEVDKESKEDSAFSYEETIRPKYLSEEERQKDNRYLKMKVKELEQELIAFNDVPRVSKNTQHIVDAIKNRINIDALIEQTGNFDYLADCSDKYLQLRESWLQFLMVYGEYELEKTIRTDKSIYDAFFRYISSFPNIVAAKNFTYAKLVDQLLIYHGKVVSTYQYPKKFDAMARDRLSVYDISARFVKEGFSENRDVCFNTPMSGSYYVSPNVNAYLDGISLDAWLYSFWLRRYQEGTFDIAYLALKAIQVLVPARKNERKDTYLVSSKYQELNKTATSNSPYDKLLYGYQYKGYENTPKIHIPLHSEDKIPADTKLYPVANKESSGVVAVKTIARSGSVIAFDSAKVSASHFYATQKNLNLNLVYKPDFIDSKDKITLNKTIVDSYGEGWAGKYSLQGEALCHSQPEVEIHKFTSLYDDIFVVNSICADRSNQRVFFSGIFKLSDSRLQELWVTRGLTGLQKVLPHYVADLNGNGKPEVIIEIQSGENMKRRLYEVGDHKALIMRDLENHYLHDGDSTIYSKMNSQVIQSLH